MVDHVLVADMMVGDARQIDHMLPVAAAGDADVGLARLAGAVDDAAEHRERHWRADMAQPLLERLDGADDVEALARAGRAGDDADTAVADAERFQDLEAGADLLLRLGRERDPDRVANAEPEQGADADRALHGAAAKPAGLGDAEMERTVDRIGELLIGGDG